MAACVREAAVNDEMVAGSYSTEVSMWLERSTCACTFVARFETRRVSDAER